MTPTSSLRFGAPLLLLAVVLASSTASSRSFAARASITRPGSVSAAVSFPAGGLFRVGRGGSSPDSTTGSTILASNNNEVSAPEDDVEVVVPSPAPASSSKMGPKAAPPGLLRRLLPSFPWHTLPDSLTYLRCMAIPLLVVLFYIPKEIANRNVWVSLLFAGASITDWADGYLARRWDITSAFGAFLDPVADKLMVSTALIILAGHYGARVAIPSAIILAREIAVSALREWMAQKGLRDSVKVGYQGKVKTAATMVALTVLLLVPTGADASASTLTKLLDPALYMLYLSALVTVTSGSVYFRAAAPVLMEKK